MCKLCSLEENTKEYSHIPHRELERILTSWRKARMEILSKVPFDLLDRFLKKLDRHFQKVLSNY